MNKDSAKKLKSILGNPRWIKLTTLALLILSIVGTIAGIAVMGKEGDPSKAIEFYPAEDEMKNKYVYLDVTGVSDYVASRGTEYWYVAVDAYGYGYVVKLNFSQFAALRAHNDWWNAEEEYDITPTRIYGMATKISDELADVIRDVFDYGTREEVFDVFGIYLLDSTSNPNEKTGGIIVFLTIASFIAMLVFLGVLLPRTAGVSTSVKRLSKLGLLDEAAAQIDSPLNEIIGNDATRISQDFIYSLTNGTAVALSDILWLYGHIQRYNGAVVGETLRAGTKDKKINIVAQKGKKTGIDDESYARIMEVVQERFPDTMLGYSLENLNRYNELCKAEKAKESGNG